MRRQKDGFAGVRALRTRLAVAAALFLSTCEMVAAQSGATPRADPQQAERQLRAIQTERRLQRPPVRVPALQSQQTNKSSNGVRFVLQTVSLTGATAIPEDVLAARYRPYLNMLVSQAELEQITSEITQVYRDAGFHLSRAIIPPQDVRRGHLAIQVVEGSIDEIIVDGERANAPAAERMLHPLTAERPSRLASVERRLLLVNDLPGLRVADTALDEIGEASGHFRLVVKITSWKLYQNFALDNYGSSSAGPLEAFSSTAFNSIFRPGDSIGVNLSTVPDATRELRYGRLSYDTPIGDGGFRLGSFGSYSEVWPGDERRALDTRTLNQTYDLRASFPMILNRTTNLSLYTGVAAVEEKEQDSAGITYEDHLRVIRLGTDLKIIDDLNGTNFAGIGLRQGIDAFNASQQGDLRNSRLDAKPSFSVFEFNYARLQQLLGTWSVKASITGQLASGPLFSSQAFYLGGAAFGPSYYSGDNGISGLVELRYDHHVATNWLKGLQPFAFVDGGRVWNASDDSFSLASVGVGLRAFFAKDLNASISIATPLAASSPSVEAFHGLRVLFSVSSAFKL